MTTKNNVLDVFKKLNKLLRPGDIAKEIGIASKEVSKIVKELEEEGKVHHPKQCNYALK